MPRIWVWPKTVIAVADVGDAGAGDELQAAAIDRERRQRRDQRVDLEPGDQHAVDDAEQHAPAAADQERDDRRQAELLGGEPGHDAGEGEDAADREVEHAADHQHHHAAREDAGLRGVEQDDRGVRRAREGGRLEDRHHDDQGDDQHDQQQLPVGGDARPAASLPRERARAGRLDRARRERLPVDGRDAVAAHAALAPRRAFGAASSRMAISVAARGVELAGDPALRHDDDAVRQRQDLRQVGGHHQERHAARRRGRAGCGRCRPWSRRRRRASARRR